MKTKQDRKAFAVILGLLLACLVFALAIQNGGTTEEPSTPTRPPRATRVADPARAAALSIDGNLGDEDIRELVADEIVVSLSYHLDGCNVSVSLCRNQANQEYPRLICAWRAAGFTQQNFVIKGMADFTDAAGNEFEAEAITVILEQTTAAKINCSNLAAVRLAELADSYKIHPSLQ